MEPKTPKPKKTGVIRWKYALPAAIVIGLVLAFNYFFLDALLKRGLIMAGELALGAKVEIASLKLKWSDLSLTVRGVAAANKDNPMTNLVEFESARLAIKPLPLLSKKLNIEEASLTGLRWGTERKTSGALPPAKQKSYAARLAPADSPTGKLLAKLETQAETEWQALPAWDNIQKVKNQISSLSLEGVVKPENLETLKQAEALKQEAQNKAGQYRQKLQNLDVAAKVQAVQPALEELKGMQIRSAQDAAAAKDKIDTAQRKIQELQALQGQLQQLKAQAESDFGQAASLTQKLNEWKEKDLAALSSQLQLPSLSFENLTRSLVGPLWLSRVRQFVDLANTARRYMPPRKEKDKKVVQPRLHGLDVSFPLAQVPPAFLIQKLSLTGSTGGPGKTGEPVDFVGLVTNITSDPRLLGLPTKAEIKGAQSGRVYDVTAVLDHTADVPKDTVALSAQGLAASSLHLPSSDYMPNLAAGQVAFSSRFTLQGDELEADLQAALSGLKPPAAGTGDEAKKLLAELWQGVNRVNLQAKVKGRGDDLQLSLSSDLDRLLGDRLKAMAGEKLAEVRAKLMAEINKYAAAKQKELLDQYGLSKSGALGDITSTQGSVQDKIAAIQKAVQEKQAAAQQAVDQQKKQAEDQAKQKAQEQLKNLFGK
ncbi:MAG: TIGR03545 family protein [candidate division FCPU426 bacterium]